MLQARVPLRFFLISTVVSLPLLGDALMYAALPANPYTFRVEVWQVGVLLAANRLIRLVTNELAGRIRHSTDDPKRHDHMLLLAGFSGALITAGYALPFGFFWLLTLRILWGTCWSVLRIEGYVTALESAETDNRGVVFGTFQAMLRLGQGGGALVGAMALDLLGVAPTFAGIAAVVLIGTALAAVGLARQRASSKAADGEASAHSRTTDATVRDTACPGGSSEDFDRDEDESHGFGDASAETPGYLRLWVRAISVVTVEEMVANLTGLIIASRIAPGTFNLFGVTTLTGLLLAFRYYGMLAIGPGVGYLSDRFGRRPVLTVLLIAQVFAMVALVVNASVLITIAALLIHLVTGSAARITVTTEVGDHAPQERRALHMGRYATLADLGTAVSPLIGFALYSAFELPGVAALTIPLIATALLCPSQRRHTEEG